MTNELKLNNNSISLAGEFAVLSQLSLRGFDANMTLGHTKGVDILISDPRTNRMCKMEVKTHFRNTPTRSKLFGHCLAWVMSEKNETIYDSSLLYCFVVVEHPTNNFRYFIVPSDVVSRYVKEQHQYWLTARDGRPNLMRQFRIGLEDGGYSIDTPLAKDYEDRWDFI